MIPAFLADIENRKRHAEDDEAFAALYATDNLDLTIVHEDDDEVVLQSKGGSMPPQPSPMEQAQAQIAIDEARAAREAAAAAEQARIEEQDRQELIARATEAQATGYTAARDAGQGYLDARGISDNYGILDAYNNRLDTIRSTIGEEVTNTAPYYNESVFDNVFNDIQGGTRTRMMNDFQSNYAPGFAEQYFGASADDNIINELLDTREADARATLQRSFDRGQINQTGYDRAMSGLGEQRSSANATLQSLGGNVLTDYRSSLDDFAQGIRDQIGNYTLGSYNPTTGFDDRLNTRVSEQQGTLRGSILESLGDTSLFDTSSLLTDAGAYQGVTNTALPSTATTLGQTSPTQQSAEARRRRTSSGAF